MQTIKKNSSRVVEMSRMIGIISLHQSRTMQLQETSVDNSTENAYNNRLDLQDTKNKKKQNNKKS